MPCKVDWKDYFNRKLSGKFNGGISSTSDEREAHIDTILELPLEEAFLVIVEAIPRLDSVTWLDYQRRLSARTQQDSRAVPLLKMAHMMVEAENNVRQVLALYDSVEAVVVTKTMLNVQDRAEQFTTLAFLQYLANTDAKARAVWGCVLQG